jgi:hypothetical protein
MVVGISGGDASLDPRVNVAREPAALVSLTRAPLRFGRIVIIGGGCYGSWYAQQLERATTRGALSADEIVVVDRHHDCLVGQRLAAGAYAAAPIRLEVDSWAPYVARWLGQGGDALEHDAMVPSPLMPHLCLDWLMERARSRWPDRTVAVEPLTVPPPMPWERAAPDGRHYVSFATWMCPVNCIEPARCPATRGPRDWSMPFALREFAAGQGGTLDQALIFHCEHRTYGVGMIDARPIADAADRLTAYDGDAPHRVLVGTVSHCHGALGVLAIT